MAIGLALLLPFAAFAVTTQNATALPSVELAAFAYDAGTVRVDSKIVLIGSESMKCYRPICHRTIG